MRRSAVIRLSLAVVLPVAIATACSDSPATGVVPGDGSSLGTGGKSGSGTSGSGTNTQGSPTAADSFSLVVHVTTRPATGDTSAGISVAGATATLTKTEWTFIHGNGGDTMSGHTVTVGSQTTDANGDAHFAQLSADLYRVIVTRPGTSDSASSSIELLHVAKGYLPIVLRRLP
jgi:hypothetical protein